MHKNRQIKIAVVHDHLGFAGGGERTVLLLAEHLGADFVTAYKGSNVYPEMVARLGDRFKALAEKPVQTRGLRFFWLRRLFFLNRKLLKDYDIVIASSPAATEAVAFYTKRNCRRIVYTHTTPRRVFDLYELSRSAYPFFLRPFYSLFVYFWKNLYIRANSRFIFNIANSQNVRQRIKNHTGSDANAVVWPPIMADRFKYIESGDYYLSFGRLDEAKRIELIVEAFQKMPEKKLVIASGGPRLEKIRQMAAGYHNIEVKGWVTDKELSSLVGRCRATIYIPIDEDAGMTHLESNAAGKPYLGVKDGGLIESTIEEETGILLPKDFKVPDIVSGVNRLTSEWCLARKEKCIQHSANYTTQKFYEKIDRIIFQTSPLRKVLGIDASRWEDPRFPGKQRRTGVETVCVNTIKEISKNNQQKNISLRLYTPRTIQSLPLSIQKVIPARKNWTRKALGQELGHNPVDWFFSPGSYIPRNAPENSFAIIHDVIFRAKPGLYSGKERLVQELAARFNIKRSKKIFTVSESSRNDIIKYFKVPGEKIVVAPMGYCPRVEPGVSQNRSKEILYIGRVEKKKSVDILIKAFLIFSSEYPDWKLKIAGADGFGAGEIRDLARPCPAIEFLGYVSEGQKWQLLSQAGLFVHPSANEGAAIPLFEAMDAQVPILASDAPVIKEFGGEAVKYFRAGDEKDLAQKIKKIISDPGLGKQMLSTGKERLKAYSWEKMAQVILSKIIDG